MGLVLALGRVVARKSALSGLDIGHTVSASIIGD